MKAIKLEIGLVFAVGACLFCLCNIGVLPGTLVFYTAFGWMGFLGRVIPQLTVNWVGVITAIVCVLALAVGLHHFLRWSFRQAQPEQRWALRWTLSILGVVVLMFVAGIAAVGVSHQAVWLATSPEPLGHWGSQAAARTMTMNNLKQTALACFGYHDTYKTFPPGALVDAQGRMQHGWLTLILPFVEADDVYQRINLKVAWDHPENRMALQTQVPTYLSPMVDFDKDADGFALSHFAGNVRVIGGNVPRKIADITDGTSNTLLIGQVAGNYKPWGHPLSWRDPARGINKTPDGFGCPAAIKGAHFALADGSVRFISEDVSPEVLKALSTPNGGEPIPDF